AARRPHPFLRRYPDLAAQRSQLPRDPDQRPARAGAQRPARRDAPSGDSPRPRRLRAELARRWLPVPGRRRRLRVICRGPRARRPQGPRQAGEIRRSLHAGDPVLEQPERCREAAHHQRLPFRAVAGADPGGARADGVGMPQMPVPMPKVLRKPVKPEVATSPALSLMARPGDGSIRARRVALLVADGVKIGELQSIADRLAADGAVPRFLASRLGAVSGNDGATLQVDGSVEALPSVLFDAVVLPDGADAVDALAKDGRAIEFVKDQYRHCKPILALGAASALIERAGIAPTLT